MISAEYDFTIERGATFELPLQYADEDGLVNFYETYDLARMHVRPKRLNIPSTPPEAPLLELTTANSRLVMEGTTLFIRLSAAVAAALPFKTGEYDIELVANPGPDEIVDKPLHGTITVTGEVTI